jgi:hypothetical protein
MRIKDTRILQNGALAGYVYYSKEKKWKWRIIGRNEKKGGQEKKIIEELKKKGKYDEWVKSGSYFGYINERPRLYEYENMNGIPRRFSLISKHPDDEKEGITQIPVFKFVQTYKNSPFSGVESATPYIRNSMRTSGGPAIPSIRRNMSDIGKTVISLERLETIFKSLIDNKSLSLLILIGEPHTYDVDINSYIQSQILEIINNYTEQRIPIYSEMPKEIMAEINRNNNKSNKKLLNSEKLTFLRLYYYLKYLQKPTGKNFIIPSNISSRNRVNKSCNPEYSEDIKKICQEYDITVAIMGVAHIKCIKDILDNYRLENGKIIKVITIISNTRENMLELTNKCSGKLSKNNSKNSYDLLCDALNDSILLDIPNINVLSKELFRRIMSIVFNKSKK